LIKLKKNIGADIRGNYNWVRHVAINTSFEMYEDLSDQDVTGAPRSIFGDIVPTP